MKKFSILLVLVAIAGAFWFTNSLNIQRVSVEVKPNLEEQRPEGGPYNPSTQSFLRGHHWLDSVTRCDISVDKDKKGTVRFISEKDPREFLLRGMPMKQMVPVLYYDHGGKPDDFDALNLLLAEYSRNGMSVPIGEKGDEMAHFQTDFPEAMPWTLKGNYDFDPNPYTRPLRVSLINNCLAPGLWELNAVDRGGEIYHSWFQMPDDLYYKLVAETNGLEEDFARDALKWRVEEVELQLDRLREEESESYACSAKLLDAPMGYSSQDSRRKLRMGFIKAGEEKKTPERLADLYNQPVWLSSFVPPGKYTQKEPRRFDLSPFSKPEGAQVRWVKPLTRYRADAPPNSDFSYLEMVISLGEFQLVVGNLPVELMTRQEDFVIPGFGVGVLQASAFAERRKLLLERGPSPSYAYLVRLSDGKRLAVNNHELGMEQVFVRTHAEDAEPYWELTVTSYERIADLFKYQISIPSQLQERVQAASNDYKSPIFLTYRDDNVR